MSFIEFIVSIARVSFGIVVGSIALLVVGAIATQVIPRCVGG